MGRDIASIGFGLLLAGIGVLGGYFAAVQGKGSGEPADAHAAEAKELSAQTLANLGVRVGEAALSDFVASRRVQAEVVDPPLNRRPVSAPLGGVVQEVKVRPNATARGGDVLVVLLRDPIARPELAIVGPLLSPVGENVHEAVATYRAASKDVALAERELLRIREVNEAGGSLPVVPKQREIDLAYELERARLRLENARHELEWHGVSPDEASAAGDHAHRTGRLWISALDHDGLWGEAASRLYALLPGPLHESPWTIALIGELIARGVDLAELTGAIEAEPAYAKRFAEAGSLLLEGQSVAAVRAFAAQGALEPVARLMVPEGEWDVAAIDVRVGQRVAAGETLAVLHDPRTMHLRLRPVGDEIALVATAVAAGTEVAAAPLIAGTGPSLAGLRIESLPTLGGAAAYAPCANSPVATANGFRSWSLREGLRYLVALPSDRFEASFVVPAGALADDGADRVVFRRDGSTFLAVPVHVLYEDSEVAVIANDGAIFPGEPIAMSGAFALALALQLDKGSADPHAGHSHG